MGMCASGLGSEEKVAALSSTPLFTLPAAELQALSQFFTEEYFEQGDVIFTEGEPGSEFYVIVEGEVEITCQPHGEDQKGQEDQEDLLLCQKRKGHMFGYQALFEPEHKRPATVTTNTSVSLLVLSTEGYEQYVRQAKSRDPKIQEKLQNAMGLTVTDNLVSIPFLEGLEEWKLLLLSSLFEYVTLQTGEVVFEAGDTQSTNMCVIVSGTVQVLCPGADGKEVEVARLEKGQYFGEMALMMNMPRTATIVALEPCLLLSLTKDDFQNFLDVVPEVKPKFDAVSKQRTAEQFKSFNVPFFASIPEHLFKQLADMCEIEELEPNQIVFEEGADGTKFYIVVHGNLNVCRKDEDGTEKVLRELYPPNYFGEVALVKNVERTATVKTTSRCVLLSFSKESFNQFFKDRDDMQADFEIKLAKEECSLGAVLRHGLGITYFEKHVASEYSTENLDFWKAVNEYKMLWRKATKHVSHKQRQLSEKGLSSEEIQRRTSVTSDKYRLMAEKKGREIIETFIADDAKEQVNIAAEQRQDVKKNSEDGFVSDLFDESQDEIEMLMSRDTFKRFKHSGLFQQLLEKVGAYMSTDDMDEPSQYSMSSTQTSKKSTLPMLPTNLGQPAATSSSDDLASPDKIELQPYDEAD